MRKRLLALALALAVTAIPATSGAIAILDTGIDATHAEFDDRVTRYNFASVTAGPIGLEQDTGDVAGDTDGQGTGVASLAAGATLSNAPGEAILDLRVVGQSADGGGAEARKSASAALDWVLSQQVPPRVVLLSFAVEPASGGPGLAAQVEQLWGRGVLTVVPSSGSGSELELSPYAVTVTGTTGCVGVTSGDGPPKPDLAAPSQGLRVATPAPAPILAGDYALASGNQYAAAQVASTLAAMFNQTPELPVDAAAAILRSTASNVDDPCRGAGILAHEAAMQATAAWTPAPEPEAKVTPAPLALLSIIFALVVAKRRR